MNKLFKKIAGVALGLTMAIGVGVAIGESKEVVPASAASTTTNFTLSSASAVSEDGVTVNFEKGSGSNAPAWYSAGLRFYASNTISISCSDNITGVSFNWEKQGSKAFASVTASTGTYSHPTAAGAGTWTGSATSITFTLGSSGQLQLNTFSVTHESSGPSSDWVTTAISISKTNALAESIYNNTEDFPTFTDITVTKTQHDKNEVAADRTVDVTSSATLHWVYSDDTNVTLPISTSGTYDVKIWASVEGETLDSRDNASDASKYVTGTLTVQEAPLSIDYTFVSGDQSRTIYLKDNNNQTVATLIAFKGNGSTAPAWNNGEVRVYAKGYFRLTVETGYIVNSVKITFVANKNKKGVAPTGKYYCGDPGEDFAKESFEQTCISNNEYGELELIGGHEFAVYADGTAGNLGFTKISITYSREIVTNPELRVSTSNLVVGVGSTNSFVVSYFNLTSDFSITSSDETKVTVNYVPAHGEEGNVEITVNGIAITSTNVTLTISAEGAADVAVSVAVKQIEQFKKVTTIDKLVDNAEFVFSDDSVISSEFDSNKNRYNMVSCSPKNSILSPEDVTYVKFRLNLTSNGYTIFDITKNKYLAADGVTTGSVKLADDTTESGVYWTISCKNEAFEISNADTVNSAGIYLKKNSSNSYFACYGAAQANMRIYIKNADSITTSQSLDAFGKLFLRTIETPLVTEETGIPGTDCIDNNYYLNAKRALAGDWSVIKTDLQGDATGLALRYEAWARASKDAAPYDGNVDIQSKLNYIGIIDLANINNNVTVVIIIVSIISVVALSGYFLLKKKKEQ